MENTLENKSRFFALYWGQQIAANIYDSHEVKNLIKTSWLNSVRPSNYILLKPISLITDTDAIEVVKLMNGRNPTNLLFRNRKGDSFASPTAWKQLYYLNSGKEESIIANFSNESGGVNVINGSIRMQEWNKTIDYLRSKGYALHYMGLSVEKQVEYGWIKLID